jgi:hypothetical protein
MNKLCGNSEKGLQFYVLVDWASMFFFAEAVKHLL